MYHKKQVSYQKQPIPPQERAQIINQLKTSHLKIESTARAQLIDDCFQVEDGQQMMQEMRRLYGDDLSAEILSTETAMQSRCQCYKAFPEGNLELVD